MSQRENHYTLNLNKSSAARRLIFLLPATPLVSSVF